MPVCYRCTARAKVFINTVEIRRNTIEQDSSKIKHLLLVAITGGKPDYVSLETGKLCRDEFNSIFMCFCIVNSCRAWSTGKCGTVQRGVSQFLHVHPMTFSYGHQAMSADLDCGRVRMLVAVPAR